MVSQIFFDSSTSHPSTVWIMHRYEHSYCWQPGKNLTILNCVFICTTEKCRAHPQLCIHMYNWGWWAFPLNDNCRYTGISCRRSFYWHIPTFCHLVKHWIKRSNEKLGSGLGMRQLIITSIEVLAVQYAYWITVLTDSKHLTSITHITCN